MPKSKHRRKPTTGSAASAGSTADIKVSDKTEEKSKPKERVSPVLFFQQVRDEARKVTWTTRSETMVSTIMVLVMVVIMSIFFFTVDEILRRVIPMILNITA